MKTDEIKNSIRKKILQKRDSIPQNSRKEKDSAIMNCLINLLEFKNAKTIFFYASFRSEVDTLKIIKTSLAAGKKIILPKVDKKNKRLKLYEIKGINELKKGYMKIPEPSVSEKRLRQLDNIDLIIIPGAAFDIHGNRLGYGAGYYDKLLSGMKKMIPIIAPAYEEQIVEKIPSEPHDVRIDKAVTEKRIVACKKIKQAANAKTTADRKQANT